MSLSVRFRTLPLEKDVFKGFKLETIGAAFFDGDMLANVDEDGYAYIAFQKQDLPVENDLQFVLFQYQEHIVACAMLIDVDRYKEIDDEGFAGHYVFNASSVVTFKPVSQAALKGCFPGMKPMGVRSQELDKSGFDAFVALVSKGLYNIELEDFAPQEWIRDQLAALEAEG